MTQLTPAEYAAKVAAGQDRADAAQGATAPFAVGDRVIRVGNRNAERVVRTRWVDGMGWYAETTRGLTHTSWLTRK